MKTFNVKIGENQSAELVIKVVENEEERLKTFIVRAIVYMHEQECPYPEEFDHNDFTATQIIGMINGEPVLTARIRYFGTFVKLERLAIREKYRGKGLGHNLLEYLLAFCKEKGFKDFYLHAQKRLEKFYLGYGFKVIGDSFSFSDHEYIEMAASFNDLPKCLTASIDAMILNRPEGKWDQVGPIEKSLQRMPEMERV